MITHKMYNLDEFTSTKMNAGVLVIAQEAAEGDACVSVYLGDVARKALLWELVAIELRINSK